MLIQITLKINPNLVNILKNSQLWKLFMALQEPHKVKIDMQTSKDFLTGAGQLSIIQEKRKAAKKQHQTVQQSDTSAKLIENLVNSKLSFKKSNRKILLKHHFESQENQQNQNAQNSRENDREDKILNLNQQLLKISELAAHKPDLKSSAILKSQDENDFFVKNLKVDSISIDQESSKRLHKQSSENGPKFQLKDVNLPLVKSVVSKIHKLPPTVSGLSNQKIQQTQFTSIEAQKQPKLQNHQQNDLQKDFQQFRQESQDKKPGTSLGGLRQKQSIINSNNNNNQNIFRLRNQSASGQKFMQKSGSKSKGVENFFDDPDMIEFKRQNQNPAYKQFYEIPKNLEFDEHESPINREILINHVLDESSILNDSNLQPTAENTSIQDSQKVQKQPTNQNKTEQIQQQPPQNKFSVQQILPNKSDQQQHHRFNVQAALSQLKQRPPKSPSDLLKGFDNQNTKNQVQSSVLPISKKGLSSVNMEDMQLRVVLQMMENKLN
eukprot:403376909